MNQKSKIPDGHAGAAILSAGIGSFVLGLAVVLTEISPKIKELFTLTAPVGPLSGKTTAAVLAWITSWIILSFLWKNKDVRLQKILIATFIMIGLGLLGTFPPFFEIFSH
ncbi:MAG: hypothetical protein HY606_06090 [Planctomycetes bacterium]|nr:hypothetical protein [Planctomycetota bacterium]